MKNLFNNDYYERGIESGLSCYSNYRWLPELTIPMCSDIISYLNVGEHETILDFGCAKGYSVKAFRLLHREAYGVDISEYAIQCSHADIKQYLSLIEPNNAIPLVNNKLYDWVVAKDVLEHVPYDSIKQTIISIRNATKCAFAIVPLGENGKYIIPEYELDITHQIREPLHWWSNIFNECGFNVASSTYKAKHIKSNWSKWEKGNGFFVLK